MQSRSPAPSGVLFFATLFLIASPTAAQNPVLAEVGESLPDGLGMIYAAGDHDGDGDLDLLTSAGAFFGDGGFFHAGPTLPAGIGARQDTRALAVADFNGDGRADFVIGRTSGTPAGLVLFLAPTTGPQFTVSASAFTNTDDLVELAAADFDNDGDIDLIAASDDASTTQWELLLNNGAGVFTAASGTRWPVQPIAASWIGVGDFDNDGWPDVFAGGPAGLLWRRNFGGGFFSMNRTVAASFVPTTGAIGDFNGDGFDDVTVVSSTATASTT